MSAFNPGDRIRWTRNGRTGEYVGATQARRVEVRLDCDGGSSRWLEPAVEPEVAR